MYYYVYLDVAKGAGAKPGWSIGTALGMMPGKFRIIKSFHSANVRGFLKGSILFVGPGTGAKVYDTPLEAKESFITWIFSEWAM